MPRRKKRVKPRGRPSALSMLSVAQLMSELDRRRSLTGDLETRRAALEQELDSVDREIAQLEALSGAGSYARRRGRPRGQRSPGSKIGNARRGRHFGAKGRGGNKKSLPMLLHGLLKGRTMSVPEMADAAKKAGHKSKSKNFRTIVSLALISHRKMFKRVSRGQYTAQ